MRSGRVSSRVLNVKPGLQEHTYFTSERHSTSTAPGEHTEELSESYDVWYIATWIIPTLAGCVLAGLLLVVYYYISAALDRESSRVESSMQKSSVIGDKSRPILACFYDPESAHRMNWGYDLNIDFKHRNCTHIIYQNLLYTDGRVHAEDEAHARVYIPRFVALRRPGFTLMASLTFEQLPKVVAYASVFAKNLVTWLTTTGFQGVDIDIGWNEDATLFNKIVENESLGSVYKATRSMAKLVPTISFMSREFELVAPFTSGDVRAGLPASDYGPPGVYTNTRGLLAYYEICDTTMDSSWITQWQNTEHCYMAVRQRRFLVLEDESSISCKMRYLTQHQFAGVALKDMDMDVFRDKCGKINPLFLMVLDILLEYTVPVDAVIQWPFPDPVPKGVIKADGKVECIPETSR